MSSPKIGYSDRKRKYWRNLSISVVHLMNMSNISDHRKTQSLVVGHSLHVRWWQTWQKLRYVCTPKEFVRNMEYSIFMKSPIYGEVVLMLSYKVLFGRIKLQITTTNRRALNWWLRQSLSRSYFDCRQDARLANYVRLISLLKWTRISFYIALGCASVSNLNVNVKIYIFVL